MQELNKYPNEESVRIHKENRNKKLYSKKKIFWYSAAAFLSICGMAQLNPFVVIGAGYTVLVAAGIFSLMPVPIDQKFYYKLAGSRDEKWVPHCIYCGGTEFKRAEYARTKAKGVTCASCNTWLYSDETGI